jgi:NTP pyrophosphatase (non-canonical NTP hydrolase)
MSNLTFAALRAANIVRCARWHSGGVESWSLSDWMTATCGELGEAANVVKKLNRVRDGLAGNDKTPEQLREMLGKELADTAIYLDLLAASAGVDLGRAIIDKFNEVSVRNNFPDRLVQGDA